MNNLKKQLIREKTAEEKRHWVRLTRLCNNRCVFCSDSDSLNGSSIAIKEIKHSLIEGLNNGCCRVVLSGGEPTLHPNFLKIVKLADSLGYKHIQIITNGRKFEDKKFTSDAISSGVNEVTFSFHGNNATLHDKQTGVNGSFSQSIFGLLNCLSQGNIIVNIDVVINKINVNYLPGILNFFISLGVTEFDLLQVIPFGRAWKNWNKVFYNLNDNMPSINAVLKLSLDQNMNIWFNRFPPEYLENYEYLIQHSAKIYDEIFGRLTMFNDYFINNKVMRCFGVRCRYCFLRNFCKDLIELKKNNVLKNKKISKCLNKIIFPPKEKYFAISQGRIDIFKFADFYLKYRNFIKGRNCRICKYNASCSGFPYDYIRLKGFNSIEFYKKLI